MRFGVPALLLTGVAWFGTVAAACDSAESIDPIPGFKSNEPTVSTATGAGGMGAAGGAAGEGGTPEAPSRGDPSEFPSTCLATCVEACARLDACHGDASPIYPITNEDCEARCAFAANGPIWDDVSPNFRCCASQEDCGDVQHCGGWLAHPDPVDSCTKLCSCFFSDAARTLAAGHQAPKGYRYAPDAVMVLPSDVMPRLGGHGIRSVDRSATRGGAAIIHLDPQADDSTVALLVRYGSVLPTFLDGAGRLVAATGRLVVFSDGNAAPDRALAKAARLGARRVRRLVGKDEAALDRVRVVELDPFVALDVLNELTSQGIDAELDMIRPYEKRYVPNDPLFVDQWHLVNKGGAATASGVDGRVDEAWDATLGDPQVILAINDDGVDLEHADFAGKLAPELNYPNDWKAQMSSGDFASHGTSCAGVAAAKADNALGGAGVCPGCTLLPHLLGPSAAGQFQISDIDIAEGFTRIVDAGAWIISNSWGPTTGNPVYVDQTFPVPSLPSVVKTAFDYAETSGRAGKGCVILFAAGNSNDRLDPFATYTTNVAVAAVGDLGLKAYYSSFGTGIGVAAPSNGGIRGITTTAANGEYTDSFGGTSSACPYAAGVVGLMLSANPDLSAADARSLLRASATRIDPVFGEWVSEGSPFYGSGLVNAYKAVALANGTCADAASCAAPSDDCGQACGSVAPCGVCRTDTDCAPGASCQALPSLGALVCVALKGAEPCPSGTQEINGYCVPSAATCGVCPGAETCNGRDEDCDGLVDEEGCSSAPRCFMDAAGCGPGYACAATSCAPICDSDDDCQSPATCVVIKDPYGHVSGAKACVASGASQCQLGCEVLASSLPDDSLAGFVECMADGEASCGSAYTCGQLLPVEF